MKETDLYPPLKRFLESQGYEVKSEIGACDVMAVRGDEAPVVVELKVSFTLDVLLQAVDRLILTPKVYVGVPEGGRMAGRRVKRVIKLLRMLGLGLVLIRPHKTAGKVTVLLDPGEYRPRTSPVRSERLLGEFAHRVGDPNLGGSQSRRGIMTAYRQKAVALAQHLRDNGPAQAKDLAQALNEPKARGIMYRNVYGWFERMDRGVYALSPRGERELVEWEGEG